MAVQHGELGHEAGVDLAGGVPHGREEVQVTDVALRKILATFVEKVLFHELAQESDRLLSAVGIFLKREKDELNAVDVICRTRLSKVRRRN